MVTDVFAVVASLAAVSDEAIEPATGTLDGLEKVDTIDDEFFAMIYSDEELLRAEFDALMAAAWTSPPPADAHDQGAEHPPESPRSEVPVVGGRLPLSVGAGRRTLSARTRAPPDIPTAASHRSENE